jgi:antitoxin component HigA of HigAB toxin-antitoxin module
MPWVFTQNHPLDTSSFINEAKRRGFDFNLSMLRELYRHALVVPFVYISDKRVGPVPPPVEFEPPPHSSRLAELRSARDKGRLLDLASAPFRSKLQFERPGANPFYWWNGIIYSRYQLLVLPGLRALLAARRRHLRDMRVISRLPRPDDSFVTQAARFRRMSTALTALEARYLPKLDPELIQLNTTSFAQWEEYRDAFDPVAMSQLLDYSADQARKDAEHLLVRAHNVDPVGSDWGRLMRRAPHERWKELKDASLIAMDYREAAEILLLFYEDLASRSEVEPLPVIPKMAWHPLHERLSYHNDTLDENLMQLGVSPHPRVVLAVEGEAEEVHAPLVWKTLGFPDAPELIRVLRLGGVDRDLQKVAALAVAPLVSGKIEGTNSWRLIKPPTRLLIAADPEGQFRTPEKVATTRGNILKEIRAVLKAQGVEYPSASELDELVDIRTWGESCYEFEHFVDDELADGIMKVHTTINGLTRDELVHALGRERQRRKDIKEVWSQWERKPSKVELAHALWAVLEQKIDVCKVDGDAEVPTVAIVVNDAYRIAQRWRYLSFVLGEEQPTRET